MLRLAQENNKRVILCCGMVQDEIKEKLGEGTDVIEFISFFQNKEESIKNFEQGVKLASGKIKSIV